VPWRGAFAGRDMQYSTFDTNLLRTLDALLAERSVTRAAGRLCVSQPAMSGSLQRLRDHFNDPLLIRVGRDMALTPLGEALSGPVRETLLRIESTLAIRPEFDPARARRTFRIGMSDYAAFVLMGPLLQRLAVEAPSIACRVPAYGPETLHALETGEIDMLVNVDGCEFVSHHRAAGDLKMRALHDDDFVCVIDAALGPILTLADYRRLPHVVTRFDDRLETLVERTWRREGLDPTVVASATGFAATLAMLPGTAMIATVQRRLAQRLAPALGLAVHECPIAIPPMRQILMWHPRGDIDPAHRYLRDLLVDVARRVDDPAEALAVAAE
jgi:LysR family transcriptional regulator, nod-box dependent transcriptional activator